MSRKTAENLLVILLYLAMILAADEKKGIRIVAGLVRSYADICGEVGHFFNRQSIIGHNTARELIAP